MTQTLEALLAGELSLALYRCSTRKRAAALIRLAERRGWRAHWLDGRAIHDKATFLSRVADALRFPAYFGHNWDAFEECLTDMLWESEAPDVAVVRPCGALCGCRAGRFRDGAGDPGGCRG